MGGDILEDEGVHACERCEGKMLYNNPRPGPGGVRGSGDFGLLDRAVRLGCLSLD